jgi:hypothetical protein
MKRVATEKRMLKFEGFVGFGSIGCFAEDEAKANWQS